MLPDNPIILPKPKRVQCTKCGQEWYWRTWWRGRMKTTCPSCKFGVIPVEVTDHSGIRIIQCSDCGRFQWYSGNRKRTSCMSCGRRNISTVVVDCATVIDQIEAKRDSFNFEEKPYYEARLKELI